MGYDIESMEDLTSGKKYLKKDSFYLETFVLPGEITSMAVGRFFNPNMETLIIAKVFYAFSCFKHNIFIYTPVA